MAMGSNERKEHDDWKIYRSQKHPGDGLYLSSQMRAELELEGIIPEKSIWQEHEASRNVEETHEKSQPETHDDDDREKSQLEAEHPDPRVVGKHKVLVNLENWQSRLVALKDGLQADRDHAKREKALLSRALDVGANRPIVRPPCWREALDALAIELPAFWRAVELIRNAYALSEATGQAPSIPPMLLVGAPGIGKSYFCRRLIEVLTVNSRWLGMDQPSAGSQLRGLDRNWGNATHGILFELIALGDMANPVIVLDEIDKASRKLYNQGLDPLAQLYSALERETSRCISDVSLEVDLDASLVLYIATANSLQSIDSALLSRFEIFAVEMPCSDERRSSAQQIVQSILEKTGIQFEARALMPSIVVLSYYAPRVIVRAVEKAAGAAVAASRKEIRLLDIEAAVGLVERVRPLSVH